MHCERIAKGQSRTHGTQSLEVKIFIPSKDRTTHPDSQILIAFPQSLCWGLSSYISSVSDLPVTLCPTGWTANPGAGTCFKVSDVNLSWPAARGMCQQQGAELVIIDTDVMSLFLWGKPTARPLQSIVMILFINSAISEILAIY